MSSSAMPDWSKIGRRIGKRHRDILHPPRDTGPSPEEREAQRLRDVLKGFAYFDTFDELATWALSDVDPVQQANTPLLKRSRGHVHNGVRPSTKLIFCHDYKGGYHDYESVRPGREPEELYSCEYLQFVEVFIYFSHKLVCCPPPSWTNLMHRNGVKVLGTFIVEPQTPDIERMLATRGGDYIVAMQLAALAETLGFDGWMLNFEKQFSGEVDLLGKLTGFAAALKQFLGPERLVIWYDALTVENEVEYQNSLTALNVDFARHADALFTNYKWTLEKLRDSRRIAENFEMMPSHVYFGVDVWAQNTNMPGPRRITYPAHGGGGTNTGLAAHVLAKESFSTAIFAPAWTFEHFSTSAPADASGPGNIQSIAKAVDLCMWEGYSLPENLCCDCRQGKPHHVDNYQTNPIVKSASEFPAGSAWYLHTDFTRAFKKDRDRLRSCLGSQAILPHLLPVSVADWEHIDQSPGRQLLYGQHEDGALSIKVRTAGRVRSVVNSEVEMSYDSSKLTTNRLCLFKVDMAGDRDLQAILSYLNGPVRRSCIAGFYTGYKIEDAKKLEYRYYNLPLTRRSDASDLADVAKVELKTTKIFQLCPWCPGARLVELGVFCRDMFHGHRPHEIVRLTSLTIKPFHAESMDITIQSIRMTQRGEAPYAEIRLAWEWNYGDAPGTWPEVLPWSSTTGPFSHFIVTIGGKEAGSAFGLEFPVLEEDCGDLGQVEVTIMGHLFGGATVSISKVVSVLRMDPRPVVAVEESRSIVSSLDM